MKITKRIVTREITEKELFLMKHGPPFDDLRQQAKNINFLMLFGGSAGIFSKEALEPYWEHERILRFIEDNDLHNLKSKVSDWYKRSSKVQLDYLTVATHLRNNFFEAYPGLMERIQKNKNFAKQNGYVRSIFGATRNLIEQLLRGDYDNRENALMMRNLDNICANTDIQNLEASIIHPAMFAANEEFKKRGLRTRIFNMVHDSADFYVYKPELKEVVDIVIEKFEKQLEELKGVPLPIDIEVSDLMKGDVYKSGRNVNHYLEYDQSNS